MGLTKCHSGLTPSLVHCAMRLLRRADVILGPVEDGGYDLLAVRGHADGLFRDIAWGTSLVLDDTIKRASELGLSYRCMSMGFDVDIPEDFARAIRSGFRFPNLDSS